MTFSLAGFVPYTLGMLRGTNKPHAFTWLIWSVTTSGLFTAQLVSGGGSGAWPTGLVMCWCIGVSSYAFWCGDRKYDVWDWIFLMSACGALIPWALTHDPWWSVLLLVIIDVLGILPTVKKSYYRPYDEMVSLYLCGCAQFTLSFLALTEVSFVTAAYPVTIFFVNLFFVVFVLARRRMVTAS